MTWDWMYRFVNELEKKKKKKKKNGFEKFAKKKYECAKFVLADIISLDDISTAS